MRLIYLLKISTPVMVAWPAWAYSMAASGYSQAARYKQSSWPDPWAAKKPIHMEASPKSITGRPIFIYCARHIREEEKK